MYQKGIPAPGTCDVLFSICLENIAVVCYTAFNDESMSGDETEGFGGGLCGAVKYIPPGAAEKGEKR